VAAHGTGLVLVRPLLRAIGGVLALTLCVACAEPEPREPLRLGPPLFGDAVASGGAVEDTIDLGPEMRVALMPLTPEQTSWRIESAPVAGTDAIAIEGAIGVARPRTGIVSNDRPVFRISAVSEKAERELLRQVAVEDFEPGRWIDYRVELPKELGSELRLRIEIERQALAEPSAQRAPVYVTQPRVVRRAIAPAPNVLLVVFDTLRADHTQAYGYERDTTPFLMTLARRGAMVRDFIASYPTTLSSHWSMFTGRFPNRHGVYPGGGVTPPKGDVLAEQIREAGYATAAFTEGGYVHSLFGFHRGFDRYHNGAATRLEDHSGRAPETFALARDWITNRSGEPWFVFLHTYQVHGPYAPPERYRRMYGAAYQGRWREEYPVLTTFGINNGTLKVSDSEVAQIRDLYDAEIRHLDALFRALWRDLEAAGSLDDTIVVITSDHGEDLMEHGWLQHGTTLYDPALRVPFIAVAPGRVAAGARLECQRAQPDLMPTLLELAGIPIPKELDGQSLAGALREGRCDEDRPAFSELLSPTYERHADLPLVSLRHRGWKLIHHRNSGDLERYRLEEDRGEQQPREGDAETRDLEAQLEAYLDSRPAGIDDGVEEITPEVRAQLEALGYLP
jgi:arylsulfatase A-like enzyme